MILGVNAVIILTVYVALILGTKNLAVNAILIVVYAENISVKPTNMVIICHRRDFYLIGKENWEIGIRLEK